MRYKCLHCGQEFSDKPSHPRKYCSTKCYHCATGDQPQEYECDTCGKKVMHYPSRVRGRHIYCCRQCADTAKRTRFPIICRWCNREFIVTPTQYTRGHRLCSRQCQVAENADAKNRICDICGKEFHVPFPSRKKTTCSKECQYERRRKGNGGRRKTGKYIDCKNCSKKIWIMPCHLGIKHFCGNACKDAWHSQHMRGENNPNWHNGTSNLPYPFAWNDELKSVIQDRDGNRCAECLTTENLSVHHIDYDKSNCAETNLITLCVGCNSRANFHRQSWQRRYQDMIEAIYSSD